jgi:hypothetical protein
MSTRAEISNRRLWFGIVAPASAWALHGLFSVIIAMELCRDLGRGPLVRWLIVGLSAAALVVTGAGGVVAWRSWRAVTDAGVARAEARQREQLMALAGVLVAIVFTLGVCLDLVPVLVLSHGCEVQR